MMKKFLMPFLMASLLITSALSLNSCKKNNAATEGTTTEIQQEPDRIEYNCYICNRALTPTPASIPLPPPFATTAYSCYHEYAIDETCPFTYCNLYPRHHYHFFYVGHDHNSFFQQHEHIGGGAK